MFIFTPVIRLVDFGSLKALVTVQIEGLEIRGFKVIDQGNGKPWVSSPAREVINNGQKEYFNIVRFTDEEAKRHFDNAIIEAYRNKSREETASNPRDDFDK